MHFLHLNQSGFLFIFRRRFANATQIWRRKCDEQKMESKNPKNTSSRFGPLHISVCIRSTGGLTGESSDLFNPFFPISFANALQESRIWWSRACHFRMTWTHQWVVMDPNTNSKSRLQVRGGAVGNLLIGGSHRPGSLGRQASCATKFKVLQYTLIVFLLKMATSTPNSRWAAY